MKILVKGVMAALIFFVVVDVRAEDARVLESGVLRLSAAVIVGYAEGRFDPSGEYVDFVEDQYFTALRLTTLGLGLEYGLTEWLTALVAFEPGYTVGGNVENFELPFVPENEKAVVTGPSDISVHFKGQIVGPFGFVRSDSFRAAAGIGFRLPTFSPDWEKERERLLSGEEAIIADTDKHTFGVGAAVDFDWVPAEFFMLNLHGRFVKHAVRPDAMANLVTGIITVERDYGYTAEVEIEPRFSIPIGLPKLEVGLPLFLQLEPDYVDDGETIPDTGKVFLRLSPTLTVGLGGPPLPTEFRVAAYLPLVGFNQMATYGLAVQVRAYLFR